MKIVTLTTTNPSSSLSSLTTVHAEAGDDAYTGLRMHVEGHLDTDGVSNEELVAYVQENGITVDMAVQELPSFPTIAEVIDRLVLTDGNEDYWTLNVARFNAEDDVRITPELAEALLKLQGELRKSNADADAPASPSAAKRIAIEATEGVPDEALDEMVHDLASRPASEINNGGFETQIGYLLANGVTEQQIRDELAAAKASEELSKALDKLSVAEKETDRALRVKVAALVRREYPTAKILHVYGEWDGEVLKLRAQRVEDAAGVVLGGPEEDSEEDSEDWDEELTDVIDPLLDDMARMDPRNYTDEVAIDLDGSDG